MAEANLVKDHLSKDFTMLEPAVTVSQAIEQLRQRKVTYGVVIEPKVKFPLLVTHGILSRIEDKEGTIESLAESLPRPIPIRADARLDQVVSVLANDLILNPDLAGLVIVDDQQQMIGVMPRQILARIAARMMERGGDTGRLEGASVVTGVYFYCPKDGEEQLVSYYDPANPPRCSKGHLMKRKPRSR